MDSPDTWRALCLKRSLSHPFSLTHVNAHTHSSIHTCIQKLSKSHASLPHRNTDTAYGCMAEHMKVHCVYEAQRDKGWMNHLGVCVWASVCLSASHADSLTSLSLSLSASCSAGKPPAVLIISLFSCPADRPTRECSKLYSVFVFSFFFCLSSLTFPCLSFCSSPYHTPTVALMRADSCCQEEKHVEDTHTSSHTLRM